ncbi:MAG: exo-beta-N-acetylmuramidase NamZ domain-containing protein [Gemmatimonadales bacterium]
MTMRIHHVALWLSLSGLGPSPIVRPGLDVLVTDSLHLVRGRRVGLVANQASVDQHGVHAVERLRAAGVTLVALFSPEHGFRGGADPGEVVPTTVDSATGLPIYSLYGKTFAPTPEMLSGVDVLLVDLPDVGARYFTYVSTAAEVIKAAVPRGKTVLVLDRPNPLGGAMQGNVLDTAFRSFVGRFPVPMRHGLTMGELARWISQDLGLAAGVGVVPVAGWERRQTGFATGLPFLAPSPNLKDLESLFHYPGSCLFEGTALSVGRGTEASFSQVGAPWLDTTAVLKIVRRAGLRGVRFAGTTFTPRRPGDGKFADTLLLGIRLHLVDAARYEPVLTSVVLLSAIRTVHGDRIGFTPPHFDRLAGSAGLRGALLQGRSPRRIVASWRSDLAGFERRIRPFLLYR